MHQRPLPSIKTNQWSPDSGCLLLPLPVPGPEVHLSSLLRPSGPDLVVVCSKVVVVVWSAGKLWLTGISGALAVRCREVPGLRNCDCF